MSKSENLYVRNLKEYYNTPEWKRFRWLPCWINETFHKVCIKYVEVPITTNCTLNCKECCNLIQYYQKPYMIDADKIVKDVDRLSRATQGIRMLRLLGGEPLLHKDLEKILKGIAKNRKIKNIQIVTNGTLLFRDDVIRFMRENKRISVDISNYEEKSVKKEELICQLKENGIEYNTQEDRIFWTASSDFSVRKRTKAELEQCFSKCSMDCINMLNGKLHLCPRSAHGMDLKIISDHPDDYVDLRGTDSIGEIRKKLYVLLNTRYITACDYCDIFRWKELPAVKAAEQITKKEAGEVFRTMVTKS